MKSLKLFTFMLFAYGHFDIATVNGEKNEQTGTVAQLHNFSSDVVNKSLAGKIHVDSQGESEISRHALKSTASLQFNKNYKMLLTGESLSSVDLMNDSAEVEDGLNSDAREALDGPKIDEFLLQETKEKHADPSPKFKQNFKNVYKVPKSKNKKTQPSIRSSSHASLNNSPVINDFNPEKLISSLNGNSTKNETSFHDFTNLYDHYLWDISSMSSVSQACFKEMSIYLAALKDSQDWALKTSDASGR